MSSNFLDANDMARLDRERQLTEQAERQPIEEDRSPQYDEFLDGVLLAFQRRLE